MTHSGERFAKCVNYGETIYQRQTLGVWKHWGTGRRNCMADTEALPAAVEPKA